MVLQAHEPRAAPSIVAELAWWIVERGLPALLILGALPLLVAAVAAEVLGAADIAWTLFGAGVSSWLGGVGWGILVNRVGPALARSS